MHDGSLCKWREVYSLDRCNLFPADRYLPRPFVNKGIQIPGVGGKWTLRRPTPSPRRRCWHLHFPALTFLGLFQFVVHTEIELTCSRERPASTTWAHLMRERPHAVDMRQHELCTSAEYEISQLFSTDFKIWLQFKICFVNCVVRIVFLFTWALTLSPPVARCVQLNYEFPDLSFSRSARTQSPAGLPQLPDFILSMI